MNQKDNEKPKKQKSHPTSINSRTETRPYKSFYKEGYVTPASYISELIFKKRAEFFNNGSCPESFWNSDSFKKSFKGQVISASRLLKKYNDSVIIKAISLPEAKFIFKLQDKKLIPILDRLQRDFKEHKIVNTPTENIAPAKPFGSKKRISDL